MTRKTAVLLVLAASGCISARGASKEATQGAMEALQRPSPDNPGQKQVENLAAGAVEHMAKEVNEPDTRAELARAIRSSGSAMVDAFFARRGELAELAGASSRQIARAVREELVDTAGTAVAGTVRDTMAELASGCPPGMGLRECLRAEIREASRAAATGVAEGFNWVVILLAAGGAFGLGVIFSAALFYLASGRRKREQPAARGRELAPQPSG